MTTIIVLGIIVAFAWLCKSVYIIFHYGEQHGYYEVWDVWDILISLMKHVIIYVSVLMGLWIADNMFTPIDHWNTSNHKLYGLSNNTGINDATFMLGCGTIKDVQYIFYNTKCKDGYIQTHKVPMKECYFDNESESSYLEYKVSVHKHRFGLFEDVHFECDRMKREKYIFHLRKEDMNIDNYYDISKY